MSTSSPLHTLAKVPGSGALADILAESLTGVPFLDVVFYAPAQQKPSGTLVGRRAVHANSRILMAASPYFRDLLSDRLLEAKTTAVTAQPCEDDADGDLKDGDNDDLESVLSLPSSAGSVISLESVPEPQAMDGEKASPGKTPDLHGEAPTAHPPGNARAIYLDSVSAATLEAAIFYIYTGEIYFLPMRSRGTSAIESAQALHNLKHPGRPACSPKDMYRFAHEAGLNELRGLAEESLFAQLDGSNILSELFSPFASQFPSILERLFNVLLRTHWTPDTRAALAPFAGRIVRGELPHAAPALTMLLLAIPASPDHGPAVPSHADGAAASIPLLTAGSSEVAPALEQCASSAPKLAHHPAPAADPPSATQSTLHGPDRAEPSCDSAAGAGDVLQGEIQHAATVPAMPHEGTSTTPQAAPSSNSVLAAGHAHAAPTSLPSPAALPAPTAWSASATVVPATPGTAPPEPGAAASPASGASGTAPVTTSKLQGLFADHASSGGRKTLAQRHRIPKQGQRAPPDAAAAQTAASTRLQYLFSDLPRKPPTGTGGSAGNDRKDSTVGDAEVSGQFAHFFRVTPDDSPAV